MLGEMIGESDEVVKESVVLVSMSCKLLLVMLKVEMSGAFLTSVTGKKDSRKCASPVTKMCLVVLSQNIQALACGSMPTNMKRLAIGPTLDILGQSCANARHPKGLNLLWLKGCM